MIEEATSVYGRALVELDKTVDDMKGTTDVPDIPGFDPGAGNRAKDHALEEVRYFTRLWIFAIEARSVPSDGAYAGFAIHLNTRLRDSPIGELKALFAFLGFKPESFSDLQSVHLQYDYKIGAKGGARCTFVYKNGARCMLMQVPPTEEESRFRDNAVRIIRKCLANPTVAEPPPVDVAQARAVADEAFADLDELLR